MPESSMYFYIISFLSDFVNLQGNQASPACTRFLQHILTPKEGCCMKQLLCVICAALLLCCGCSGSADTPYWEQPAPEFTSPPPVTESPEPDTVRAVWIPVMHYDAWMKDRTVEELRETLREVFASCRELGLNTVFVHVRAYGDAYYDSALFPKGAYLTGDYDPLGIMVEEGHAAGLAVHAWINPLRCETADVLSGTDAAYILRQWYDDDEKNGTYLVEVDGRCWLDPAYAEVRDLVADGIAEILDAYDVDGIHIDDYFYPTQETYFDEAAFAESGMDDLGDFRRANSSALVQTLYDTVKAHDADCIFSVSPQGNPQQNYDKQYADAARWASEEGFCDWIIPQLYFGFENETCPFAQTLADWQETATAAELTAGLAVYKIGQEDTFAGGGSNEWQDDPAVLSKQVELLLEEGVGMAFFSFDALFSPEHEAAALVDAERERIAALLHKDSPE